MIEIGEKKEDLRTKRTYKLLFEALISLLKERSFGTISVTDICERAMIHRTTFYKHFEDKYHLLRFGFQVLQNDYCLHNLNNQDFNNLQQYYMETFRRSLQYFATNHELYCSILTNNQNDSIITTFHQLLVENITLKLNEFEKLGIKYTIPVTVIANFRSGALMALIIWWVKHNMPIPIEDMVKYVVLMINDEKYSLPVAVPFPGSDIASLHPTKSSTQ